MKRIFEAPRHRRQPALQDNDLLVGGANGADQVVQPATRAHEAREGEDMTHGRDWRRAVKNRIGWNHDARARDGMDDDLGRAERWHAVY